MNFIERVHEAVRLINEDKDRHMAMPARKWNLDVGKLHSILQRAGLEITATPEEPVMRQLRMIGADVLTWLSRPYDRAIAAAKEMGHTPLTKVTAVEFEYLRKRHGLESCVECPGIRYPLERAWHEERCALYQAEKV
jgi:hypothetical protein